LKKVEGKGQSIMWLQDTFNPMFRKCGVGKRKNSTFGLGNLAQNISSTRNVQFGYGGWCVTFKGMQ
jgi:hypothetical protein